MSWIAVPAASPESIAARLGIADAWPANWRDGVDAIYRWSSDGFIAPPVNGWSLIASLSFGASHESDAGRDLATSLSRTFGVAQHFTTHRVVELHGWSKAERGVLIRRFSYLGERGAVLANDGAQAPEEAEQGMPDLSGLTLEEASDAMSENEAPDEEDVMRIAAKWSVDPSALDENSEAPGVGLLFRVTRRFF